MKIKDFTVFPVATPPPHTGGRCWIFLKLTADDGIDGIGEIYGVPFRPATTAIMAAEICEMHFIGRDPHDIESIWRTVYSRAYSQRPDPSLTGILSAAEMACWDIIGKAANRPVHALLGGQVRDALRTYTYLYPDDDDDEKVYTDATAAANRAAEYAAAGFTAVKFDPAGPYTSFDPRQLSLDDLARSESFARQIREAVGGECDLLFGTHGQMTPAAAVRLARRLEPFDPLWLEEPTPPDNPAAMGEVARKTTIPIAAGERLSTKYEFAQILRHRAAAILQMNLGRVGGILEAKKIAGMAETYYAQLAPHLYCGPVVGAANIQLAAASPNFLILEGLKKWDGFSAQILRRPLVWRDGFIAVPEGPGLGVELDETVAREHRYTGDSLHLNPLESPLN